MNKLDLEETTRRFHNVYEQVAKEYGYKTREDTKELDFNRPNGMTMLKTVETITTPYLEEIERLNKELKQAKEIALNEHKYASEMESKYIEANNIKKKLEQYLIDVGVYDDILKCCGRYDVNGVEIRRYIEELKGDDSNE